MSAEAEVIELPDDSQILALKAELAHHVKPALRTTFRAPRVVSPRGSRVKTFPRLRVTDRGLGDRLQWTDGR